MTDPTTAGAPASSPEDAAGTRRAKLGRRSFKLGASIFVLIFVGHTIGQLRTDFGTPTPERAQAFELMDRTLGMDGSAHSILDFYRGDSYGMGFMFLAFGVLCWLLAQSFDRRALPYPRSVVLFTAVVAWVSMFLSVRFFPAPPIVFMLVASLALSAAAVLTDPER